MSTSDSIPRDDYDALPYVSMPITYSQPAHLSAQAHLRGIDAPPAETARVLEIGAASGGNIIPLAARFPRAQFHGVDLAAAHVEIGKRRIAELGLSNVTLEQGDITEWDSGGQTFDYIICHGVFSWAPPEAQRAILKVCADTLAEIGIAAISYNVFPGWHARNVIRDIALEHTRDGGSPRQKVEAVRELLATVAETSSDKSPYGAIIRIEAARLKTRPASYILGELLAAYNQPFHVREVIAQAGQHGLAYMCESDLMESAPEYVVPKAAATIRALAGDDPVALEQYIDTFSGRAFRRSLFVHAGQAAMAPSLERLAHLHVTADARPPAQDAAASPALAAVQTMLAHRYPASASVADLVAAGDERTQEILAALFDLVARGHASVSSLPLRPGSADQVRPRLWAVARSDAMSGQPWVTNLQHAPVLATPALRGMMGLMDGHADRTALARALAAALRDGRLAEADLPQAQAGDATTRSAASAVDRIVAYCARNALLEP